MKESFMDENWTGLKSMILQELEEQQCRTEGHRWVPAYYCCMCGMQSWEALEAFKKTTESKKRGGK